MASGDTAERPPTTRVGPAGGSGLGLRTLIALAGLALALAVLKPWDWIAAPSLAPGREGAAIAGVLPTATSIAASTAASRGWADAGSRIACLFGASWLAVVDQVNGSVTSRSWTRLVLVPATGPLDPAIARTHAYAESVPRIGFCAPGATAAGGAWSRVAASAPREAGAPTGAPFLVRAWRLTPRESAAAGSATPPSGTVPPGTAPPGARETVPVVLTVVSGGTATDGGALFGLPGRLTVGGAAGRAADPEGAWAAGGVAPGSARWQADDGQPAPASWAPGTYVFRVSLAGSGAGGAGSGAGGAGVDEVAWFAIELRGPWVGPGASAAP